jgi:ABC-type sugar transport system permease subunit
MQPQPASEQPVPQQAEPPTSSGDGSAKAVGVLLLMPAAVLTVLTLVIPTVRTVRSSLYEGNFVPQGNFEYVGLDNYDTVLGDPRLWPAVGFALSLVVLPLVVAVVVAPLLAAAFSWAGGWARWTARIVLSLALVVFSPVALSIAWQRAFRDDPGTLADPDLVDGTLRVSVAMMTFGMVCAVGVMAFLPAFRAGRPGRPRWPALFTIAGLATLGVLATGLQQITIPLVMTAFGPEDKTLTPAALMFVNAFRGLQSGAGAAVGVVLLVLLAILGVAAVLLVVLTRLRVSLPPPRPREAGARNPGAVVLGVLALVAMVAVAVLTTLPWLDALGGADPEIPSGAQSRTWLPAILNDVVSVGVAYLAALGISGLRPLGRHSEWLLMPFAPWLFVGVAPLSVDFVKSLLESGALGAAVQRPILVSIVALLILSVLCRGQAEQWRQQPASSGTFISTVVLPTLPVAGFLAVVVTFFNAQDLLWPLLTAPGLEDGTTTLGLFQLNNQAGGPDFSVGVLTPLVAVILGFLALAALQVRYLDRMVATTGRE